MKRPLPRQLNDVLWRTLLLGVLVPLLVFIFIAVGVGAYIGRQNLNNQQQQTLSIQTYAINTYLTQSGQALDLLSSIIEIEEVDTYSEIGLHLNNAHEALDYFDTLYWLNSDSRIIEIVPDDPRYHGLDMSQNPYLQASDDDGDGIAISQPFRSLRTGSPTVFMVLPLANGGKLAGELSLQLLQEVVENSRPANSNEELYILDHNGTVLAAPTPELVRQQANLGDWAAVQIAHTGNYVDYFHRTNDGIFVASSRPIGTVNWLLVSQTPFLTAYGPYLMMASLLSSSIVLLYILLIWNIQRRLNKDLVIPLLELNTGANAVAQGDYATGTIQSLVQGDVAEIHQLAHSFQHMSQSLHAREAALKASEQHLRLVLEFNEKIVQNVTEGIIIQNKSGTITFINPAITTLLGYKETELIGQSWEIFVLEEDREIVIEADKRRSQDLSDRYELHMVRQDGQQVPVMVSGSPWYEEGEFAGMISVIMDIATRVKHEQEQNALLAIAELLRMAVSLDEMLPSLLTEIATAVPLAVIGVWLADAMTEELDLQTVYPANALLTMDDPYNLSLPLYSQVHSQEQYIGMIVVQATAQRPLRVEEVRLLRAIAEMAATAIHRLKLNEQIQKYASELEQRVADRTRELSAANIRLRELDRLKSKFVSDVSHELRTPITNLILYLDLLEQGHAERRDKYMQILRQEANRLSTLVQSILDLSRLHKAHQKIAPAPVNLNELVQQTIQGEQIRADVAGLEIKFIPQPQLPPINGVISQIEQIVVNLLANAINYTSEGYIQIRTYTLDEGAFVCLEMTDSGMGISETDLPHLFDRFYRGQQTASLSLIPGTGLGLAIVKEIVELHQGTIDVSSELGKGSTFRVILPATPVAMPVVHAEA